MAILQVRVVPRAGHDEVAGWHDGGLRVRVTAPPEGGKANAAVEKVLARALCVPKSSVSVTRGASGRVKQITIDGLDDESVRERLGSSDAGGRNDA